MNIFKKLLALALCLMMVFSLVACGEDAPAANSGNEGNNGGEPAAEGEAPAYVTEPITIEYWHNHGGPLAQWMDEVVKEFNETNAYGITVNATYQGAYNDILTKVNSNYGSSISPNLVIVGAGGIEELADQNGFVDLAPYVKRDNFDMSNIPEALMYYGKHYEGKIIEFPFLVSTTIIYYNKAYYPTEPKTLQEWAAMSAEITKNNPGVYGMAMPMDMGFIQRPVLKSLGAPGLCTADGTGPAEELVREDSILYQYLGDYRGWIEAGHCYPLKVTDSGTEIHNAFISGKLASYVTSSASIGQNSIDAEKAGIEMGFCPSVGYDCQIAGLGGGGFAVLSDSTQQEVAACWEFMKFLLSDEKQIEKHKVSGYLPFSYTALESPELQAFWEENPGYKVAYDTQAVASYNDWSLHLNAWRTEVSQVFTGVLIDGSLSIEEAVAQLNRKAPAIFR